MSVSLSAKPNTIGSQGYAVGFVGDIRPSMNLTGGSALSSPSTYVVRAKVGGTATAGAEVTVGSYTTVIATTPSPGGIRSGTAQQALRDLYTALLTDPAFVGRYELALNLGIVQGGDTFDELSIQAREAISALDLTVQLGATSGLELARSQAAIVPATAASLKDWQAYLEVIVLPKRYGDLATILTGYSDASSDRDFDTTTPPSWTGGARTTTQFYSGTHSYAASWQAGTPTTCPDLVCDPGTLTPSTNPAVLRFKARGTASCTSIRVENDGIQLGTFAISATEWRSIEVLIPESDSDEVTITSDQTGGTAGTEAFYIDDYDYLTCTLLPAEYRPVADIDLADTGEVTRLVYPYRAGEIPTFDVGALLRTYLEVVTPFDFARLTRVPFVAFTYAYGEIYVPSGQTAPFAVPITSYGGAKGPSAVYYGLLGEPRGNAVVDFLDDGKLPALVSGASYLPTEDDPDSTLDQQVKWTAAGVVEYMTVLNGPALGSDVWKVRYERTYEDGDTVTTYQELGGGVQVPFNVEVLGRSTWDLGGLDGDDIPTREVRVTIGLGATGNDADFTPITNRRRYRYIESYRTAGARSLVFLNAVGGWDTLPVVDTPTETVAARRETIQTDAGLRNAPIETSRQEVYTVPGLTRDEMLWLRDLVTSRFTYLGTSYQDMERVTIVDHAWQVDQSQNSHTLTFTLGYDVDTEGV